MALNIKDSETERLAGEVAALAAESKTRAVRVALEERKKRLVQQAEARTRADRLRRFLEDEAWPQLSVSGAQALLSKQEREAILGYGSDGV